MNKMKQVKLLKGRWTGQMVSCLGVNVDAIFPCWDYGHVFAYLWRRFGPPHDGYDGRKELVTYMLTTARTDVVLFVIVHDKPFISLRYRVKEKLFYEMLKERRLKSKPLTEKIISCLVEAMHELLKPTEIRDTKINIEGPVQDPDNRIKVVPYSEYAGLGVIPAYLDALKDR